MSGIEVAGLLLAAPPLLISWLEHYRDCLKSIDCWRHVRSEYRKCQTVAECLHAYGIHSATLQPELVVPPQSQMVVSGGGEQGVGKGGEGGQGEQQVVEVGAEEGEVVVGGSSTAARAAGLRQRTMATQGAGLAGCRLACGNVCEPLMCCN